MLLTFLMLIVAASAVDKGVIQVDDTMVSRHWLWRVRGRAKSRVVPLLALVAAIALLMVYLPTPTAIAAPPSGQPQSYEPKEPPSNGDLPPDKDPRRKCGLNLALVVDNSGSITTSQMQTYKRALLDLVAELEGTPTKISLITFATNVPSWNGQLKNVKMDDEGQVSQLKNKIKSMRSFEERFPPGSRGRDSGHTNWPAAFDSATGYDTAIFVTDGLPTSSDSVGIEQIKKSDLEASYAASDRLRDSGTAVYTIGVGMTDRDQTWPPPNKVWIANNEGRAVLDASNQPGEPVAYDMDAVGIGYVYAQDGNTLWGNPPNRTGDLKSVDPNDYSKIEGYRSFFQDRLKIELPNPAGKGTREFPVYKVNLVDPYLAMKRTSNRVVKVSDAGALTPALKAAVEGCRGTVNITKSVDDPAGTSPEGFTFTADHALTEQDTLGSVSKTTDEDGRASFKLLTEGADSLPANGVTITEDKKEGFTIKPSGGNAAQCTAMTPESLGSGRDGSYVDKDVEWVAPGATGSIDKIWLSNKSGSEEGSFEGFIVRNMTKKDRLSCTVVNEPAEQDPLYTISKEAVSDPLNVSLKGDDDITIAYKITVTNANGVSGFPKKIVETPGSLTGLTAKNVVFKNVVKGQDAGNLLKNKSADTVKDGDNYTLVGSDTVFNNIDANGKGIVYAVVTYGRGTEDQLRSLRDSGNGQCADGQSDKGLTNDVEVADKANEQDGKASACTSVTVAADPVYTINKEAASDPLNISLEGAPEITIGYKVTVTNSNGVAGIPAKIVETPGSLAGLTAKEVVFKNSFPGQKAAGELLKSATADTTKSGDTFTLAGSDAVFNTIEAGGSKVVYAVVTYTRGSADELRALRDGSNAQCQDGKAGKGLTNNIEVSPKTSDDKGQADACTSVVVSDDPTFSIVKSGDQDTVGMQPTGGGEYTVSYTLTVNNTSSVPGVPAKITETPGVLPGLSIAKVVYENLSGSTLVKNGPVEKTSAPWDLTSADMNSLEQRGKAEVKVSVTYNGGTDEEMKALRDSSNLTCNEDASGTNDNGPGLRNSASITNIDGGTKTPDSSDCVSVTFPTDPEFSVKKVATGVDPAPKKAGQTFDARYTITVTNTSTVAGTPYQIIEKPSGPTGVTVKKVVFSNGTLLKNAKPVPVTGTKDSYVLEQGKMVEIPAGESREVEVTVTYQADADGTAYKDLLNSGNLQCGDKTDDGYPEGKGLRNKAQSVNKDGDEPKGKGEVCDDIAKPDSEFEVAKVAQEADAIAAPSAGEIFDVEYTITVTNTSLVNGKPFKIVDTPKAPKGLVAKKVVFKNGSLLADGSNPTPIDAEQTTYELFGDDMVDIPAGESKDVIAVVTYRVKDEDAYKKIVNDSEKLTCGTETNGSYPGNRGLVNKIESYNKDGDTPQKGDDEVCKEITPPKPTFTVTKTPKGPAVASATEQGEFEVVYTITVANTSLVNAAPSQIVESPKPPLGLTKKSVKFSGGDLLKNGEVLIEGDKDDYILEQAAMVDVPAGESKTVDVTVTYQGTSAESYKDLLNSEKMTCEEGKPVADNREEQKGLGNRVKLTAVPGDSAPSATDDTCADLNPPASTFTVNKEEIDGGQAPAKHGVEFPVKYKLTVSNTSNVNGVPFKIVEDPRVPTGLEVTGVTFEGGNLLKNNAAVPVAKAPYVLPQDKMTSIAANGKKEVFVVVTYRGTTKDDYRDFLNSGNLKCGTKNGSDYPDDKGLVNSVTTYNADGENPQTKSDEACQSVTPPDPYFSVVKSPEGNAVAAATADGTFSVKYRIEVTNDSLVSGKPLNVVDDPSSPEEIKPIKAVFSNGDLLEGDADTVVEIEGEQDTYVLDASKMVNIDPGATKTVYVTITYQGKDADSYKALLNDTSKLACGDKADNGSYPAGKGLVNKATATNPGTDNKEDAPGEACTPIEPPAQGDLTVAKKLSNADDFAVLSPGKQAVVTYLIEVSNPKTNFKSLLPANLIDSPKPPANVTVASVEAQPVGDLADKRVELLKDVANADFVAEGDSWKLSNDKFREIEPGKTGVVKVVVTYEAGAQFGADGQNTDDLECAAGDADGANKGLYNKATLEGQTADNPDDSACVPVKHGKVSVEKKINGVSADSRDDAVNVAGTADSVEISYEIINSGTAELSEVTVSDVALGADDAPTATQLSQEGLTCDNNGTFDAATKKVTFDPAVAAGTTVTCSWTLNVADIPEEDIHEQVHGDQVTGTPGYTGPGGTVVPGGDTTGKSWMKLGSVIKVTKKGLSDEVAITQADKGSVEVSYLVSITNGGKREVPLPDLVDAPQPADGITVTNVKAEPVGDKLTDGAIDLIDAVVDPLDPDGGTWMLPKANYVNPTLAAGATTQVLLTVTYDMSSVDVTNPANTLVCDENGANNGRGVSNKVSMDVDGEEESGEGCVSVTPATGTATKLINNQTGTDKDNAVPVIGDGPIAITYVYDNTGKATVPSATIVDNYMDVANGDVTDEAVPGDMTCQVMQGEDVVTGTTVTVNGDVVTINPGLAPGQKLSCTRELTVEQMKFTDQYHANKVSITPSVPDGKGGTKEGPKEETPAWAVDLPPLTGNLPDTGGNGLRVPVLFSLGLLLAGAAMALRRKKV